MDLMSVKSRGIHLWAISLEIPKIPYQSLTHWGRVTHICVSKLTIIGSDNDLSPGWCQAIIWTNVGILLIGPLGTNFSEILIEILTFSFKKMRLKVSSVKRRPFCIGLNVLKGDPGMCCKITHLKLLANCRGNSELNLVVAFLPWHPIS